MLCRPTIRAPPHRLTFLVREEGLQQVLCPEHRRWISANVPLNIILPPTS